MFIEHIQVFSLFLDVALRNFSPVRWYLTFLIWRILFHLCLWRAHDELHSKGCRWGISLLLLCVWVCPCLPGRSRFVSSLAMLVGLSSHVWRHVQILVHTLPSFFSFGNFCFLSLHWHRLVILSLPFCFSAFMLLIRPTYVSALGFMLSTFPRLLLSFRCWQMNIDGLLRSTIS